jgi:hypothetical protein
MGSFFFVGHQSMPGFMIWKVRRGNEILKTEIILLEIDEETMDLWREGIRQLLSLLSEGILD